MVSSVELGIIAADMLYVRIVDSAPPRKKMTPVTNPVAGTDFIAITAITNNGAGKVRITTTGAAFVGASASPITTRMVLLNTGHASITGPHFPIKINDNTVDLLEVPFPVGYTYSGGGLAYFHNELFYAHTALNPDTGQNEPYLLVGYPPHRKWKRNPVVDADRAHSSCWTDTAGYNASSALGGRTVTNLYHFNTPIDAWTTNFANGAWGWTTQWAHDVYIKLSGTLTEGQTYTLAFPAASGMSPITFKCDFKKLRCPAIMVPAFVRPNSPAKFGYLGTWIPKYGVQAGNYDFAAVAANGFKILSEGGRVEFSGSITLRKGWNVNDPFLYQSKIFQGYSNLTGNVRTITNVVATGANHLQITYSGTDFVNGDRIALGGGVGGGFLWSDVSRYLYNVRNVNTAAKTFELVYYDWDGTNSGQFVSGSNGSSWISGGFIYPVLDGNDMGCDVYEMDFSSWVPSIGGKYYIHIPGAGVSDPILVDPAATDTVFKAISGSLHLQKHHVTQTVEQTGINRDAPLAGKTIERIKFLAGWLAGESPDSSILDNLSYFDSATNTTYTSTMLGFSPVGHGDFYFSKYRTGIFAPATAKGWIADAGDPDAFNAITHGLLSVWYSVAYGLFPSGVRNKKTTISSLETQLGAGWAGCDNIGDLLNHAIFEAYGVYSLADPTTNLLSAGIEPTETTTQDPWSAHTGIWFSYYPDHMAAMFGAAVLASTAYAMKSAATELNIPNLLARANEFQAQAVASYAAADAMINSPSAAAAYYDPCFTAIGWTTPLQKAAMLDSINKDAISRRGFAAAALFMLTGSATYSAVVEDLWNNLPSYWDGSTQKQLTMMMYSEAAGANPTIKAGMQTVLKGWIENYGFPSVEASGVAGPSMRRLKYADGSGVRPWFGDTGYGGDLLSMGMHVVWYAFRYDLLRATKAVQVSFDYMLGANPHGSSYISGIGYRPFLGFLSEQIHEQGVDPLVTKGYAMYGPRGLANAIIYALTYANEWGSILVEPLPGPSSVLTNKAKDQPDPPMHARPTMRKMIAVRETAVEFTEFTITEMHLPLLPMALLLHVFDAQDNVSLYGGRTQWLVNGT